MTTVIRIFIVFFALLVVLVVFFSGFKDIPDGYMGVEISKIGKHRVLPEPLRAGWYWRRPLMVEFALYDMRDRSAHLGEMEIVSKEKKTIHVTPLVYYRIQEEKLVELHKMCGNNYEVEKKVQEYAKTSVQNTISQYLREEVFGEKREACRSEIHGMLKKELEPFGIEVKDIKFYKLSFPGGYIESLMRYYPSQRTRLSFSQECLTKEKSRVFIEGALFYYVEPKDAEYVHNTLGTNYVTDFLKNKLMATVDQTATLYGPEKIFSGADRNEVARAMLLKLQEGLASYKIKAEDVIFTSVKFSERYQNQLEEIQINRQEIEKIKWVMEKEKEHSKLTQFKEEEAQKIKLMQVKGENEATLKNAQTFKDAESLKAEGKAAALLKIQKILSEDPKLLQYLFIDKISDKVNVMVVPSKDGNIMLDSAIKEAIHSEKNK